MRKFAGTSKKFGGQDPWLSGEKKFLLDPVVFAACCFAVLVFDLLSPHSFGDHGNLYVEKAQKSRVV